MSDGEDEYGTFGASDENANYDDFMMSGDEDVEVVEMEEETDEEEDDRLPADRGSHGKETKNEESGVLDEARMQELCDGAGSLMEDQEFDRARGLLEQVNQSVHKHAGEPLAVVWKWRALSQVVRSWLSEMHYNGIDGQSFRGTLDGFQALVGLLKRYPEVLDSNAVGVTLSDLVDELYPPSKRDFLFAVELIADDSIEQKMQLRLQCIRLLLEFLGAEPADWADELRGILEFKVIAAKIWSDRLANGRIDLRDIHGIEKSCSETDLRDAMNDQEYTNKISLVLQCHIFQYLNGFGDLPRDVLSKLIERLEHFSSSSLSVSQHLGLMIQLSTARALVMLPARSQDDNRMELPLLRKKIMKLREQFWNCLLYLEDIGGSRQNFSSLFERFILSGFIFCSMILHKIGNDKINPFDLEHLKIAREVPYIQLLRTIYRQFLELDLRKLYKSIQRLSEVRGLLKGLTDYIYYLAQLAKLWKEIAPVYSCISLKDIQELLEIDSTLKVSRDDLLTVLMTSILNDTADVFYKLDLTQDLVYFGDNYKVQLCSHPKQSFVKKTVTIDSGVKLSHLEIANNIGVFDEPCSLKGLDSCAFFDKLQGSRDCIQAHDSQGHREPTGGLQRTGLAYSDKYEELAALANEALTFGDSKR